MKEEYEFRVREKHASRLFAPEEGVKLSQGKMLEEIAVRKIQISPDDPRFVQIGVIQATLKEHKDYFYAGWNVRRFYSTEEIQTAQLFLMWQIWTFEPAGEECGTQYDESAACPQCKAGATQLSPLFLDWKRIPKGKDIARTIAGEIVASRKMVELFEQYSITGAEFRPVRQRPASSAESKDWFQLVVKSCEARIVFPTKAGINPFDEDVGGEYRCPLGDTIGLARLSELWISHASYTGLDIIASRQFVGTRRGLLRPERFLLVSPKLRRLIEEQKLKGYKIEVAHLA